MNKFIEMKQRDIKVLRELLWKRNNKRCPVLNKQVPLDKIALDHAHKKNSDEYSETKGVIRESLDFRVNAVLGKLENSIKRTGLSNVPDFNFPEFLRNAADYFERGAYRDENGTLYVHPSEVKKLPKVSKRNYNLLKKKYIGKRRFPGYPKSGKLTIPLKKLFSEYGINPHN